MRTYENHVVSCLQHLYYHKLIQIVCVWMACASRLTIPEPSAHQEDATSELWVKKGEFDAGIF